ncbi:MAG: carbohydrate porin [Candidatus Omnitrophica bacterium]|nr:carbohydrate porin [Candidatus Omnitrophota bacterium]
MLKNVIRIATVLTMTLCLLAPPVRADEISDLREELSALKVRIAELEKKLETQSCTLTTQGTTVKEIKESLIQYAPGEGLKVPTHGIEITAGATCVLQGTPRANNPADEKASRCDAAWSADIFIQKAFDDWGLALMHLEPGQGQGAENDLSVYSNVNRDQNDTNANVPITEIWYEQYLFDKQIALTAGKLDPANYIDQNEYAHDETTQFIGRIFRQNPAIEWPDDNTLGGRIIIAPNMLPYLSLEATYFDADNDWEDVFNKPFVSAQINFKPSKLFNIDPEQWDGNYRFYWWLNDRDHPKLVVAGADPTSDTKEKNIGYGLSCDQMITDTFGAFARFGWQRPSIEIVSTNLNTAQCEASWSGGLQMIGKHWKREDDVIAFGVGQVFPSKKYKEAGVANTGGAAEGHFETYYKCQLFKWLAITPDFQWIWNPHGVNHDYLGDPKTIFVYGIRGQLDF